jgi:hypothetical protein
VRSDYGVIQGLKTIRRGLTPEAARIVARQLNADGQCSSFKAAALGGRWGKSRPLP